MRERERARESKGERERGGFRYPACAIRSRWDKQKSEKKNRKQKRLQTEEA